MTSVPIHVPQIAQWPRRRTYFPRVPLFAVLGLLGFAAAATVFGQATGIGTLRNEFGAPVAVRDITIERDADDIVTVSDARTGERLAAYDEGAGGFVRGSMRAFARLRLVAEAAPTEPYRLIEWQNGAVSISDTVTGERFYLNAFGPDQVAIFSQFLEQHGRTEP